MREPTDDALDTSVPDDMDASCDIVPQLPPTRSHDYLPHIESAPHHSAGYSIAGQRKQMATAPGPGTDIGNADDDISEDDMDDEEDEDEEDDLIEDEEIESYHDVDGVYLPSYPRNLTPNEQPRMRKRMNRRHARIDSNQNSGMALLFRLIASLATPDTTGIDSETRYALLFLATLSLMCAVPASAYLVLMLSTTQTSLIHRALSGPGLGTLALIAVPGVARISRSKYVTVFIFAVAILLFLVSSAVVSTPVVLVWSSLVPLAGFSVLPTRGVLAASGAAAAAVYASDILSHTRASEVAHLTGLHSTTSGTQVQPSMIVAAWVVFLGLVGVMQRNVRSVAAQSNRGSVAHGCDPNVRSTHTAYAMHSESVDGWWGGSDLSERED